MVKFTGYKKIKTAVFISGTGSNLKSLIKFSKIITSKIFKWIKKNNVSNKEMLKTFNCGVGFCLIVKRENIKKIQAHFEKDFIPYEIGFISNSKKRLNLINKVKW